MAPRKPEKENTVMATEEPRRRPEVIVEFLFDRGCIHLSVRNIGDGAAVGISIKFDQKIKGLGGAKEISSLPLFRKIEFLGPGREIVAFVDESHSYFASKQPTRIAARIAYSDTSNHKYDVTINHDLEIYRNLPYLTPSQTGCVD